MIQYPDQDTAAAFGKTRDRAHNAAMMGGTLAAAMGLLLGWFIYRQAKRIRCRANWAACRK